MPAGGLGEPVCHCHPPPAGGREAGTMASFEQVAVNPSDSQNPPAKGDWVTASGTEYVVTSVRQPADLVLSDLPANSELGFLVSLSL
jgi:hypothetical protein